MNADRSWRREQRFNLSYKLSQLEEAFCEPCPKSARSLKEDRENCKDCPIYAQLGVLGEELLSLSVRDKEIKIIEIPEPMKPVRVRKKKKPVKKIVTEIKPLCSRKRKEKT